jgi:membrane protein DedA with SNARE-associated domain
MVAGLIDTVLSLLSQYGYFALFIFVVLETGYVIHFVPSEVVLPVAVPGLVSGPTTFALFVLNATVAAVVGSLLAYYLFGVSGAHLLERSERIERLTAGEVERSQRWFRRWGEGLLLWGRLVPVVRTPISIPAGFAGTDLRRFVSYSAAGWLLYATALTAFAYVGTDLIGIVEPVLTVLFDAIVGA